MKKFDLVIVGGGPGGYVAAIRAANAGLSVALIEGRDLGGTCLNRGCIPSKTFLKHAEAFNQIKNASCYGITVNDFSFSMEEMVSRKNKVVKQLCSGIKGLLSQNKITFYQGFGTVRDDKTISVDIGKGTESLQASNVILATGSQPFVPEIPRLDKINYYTSDTIFDIEEVPSHMVIVGGGVIGLELACVFNSLGTKVDLVEMADRIIPTEDPDASAFLTKQVVAKGITIHTNTKITGFKDVHPTVVEMEKNGEKVGLETNSVLLSVGRVPNVIGLDELSVEFDGRFVKVDKNLRTSVSGIYAVGDLIGGYQLAHAASQEGIYAVNHILGITHKKDLPMPRCIYTFPEVASVGMTELEAKKAGYKVKTQKVDLAANGKAIAAGENSGFMKIIADEKYGEILGVVMVGAHVTEMISQATSFIHLEGTVEEMESMIHPHPTVSEALFESAAAWLGKGIHYS
ncbi:dihydrolipoyl dehydrogenase [Virgibacillus sp. AGTR]|uniref:dihydrolipoyl dehydrogenase n=1 Tax=unclassified Virgibacillus TaxID=2620237 RepID=UPI0003F83A37|nr:MULTISPECIES: dihydrolipoyl dehydrogenase [Bacillaceae]MCC2249723.1 dihydrolipoyl dehydrogenase [Virgibacillus sp. AGTR]QRZ17165.1 dihydrolipoyl dehydrogenase [Virgibacillus sp. AGTR]